MLAQAQHRFVRARLVAEGPARAGQCRLAQHLLRRGALAPRAQPDRLRVGVVVRRRVAGGVAIGAHRHELVAARLVQHGEGDREVAGGRKPFVAIVAQVVFRHVGEQLRPEAEEVAGAPALAARRQQRVERAVGPDTAAVRLEVGPDDVVSGGVVHRHLREDAGADQLVVRVEDRDEVAVGQGLAQVHVRAARLAPGFGVAYQGMAAGEMPGQQRARGRGRAVVRAVVDEQEVDVRMRLPRDALDRGAHVTLAIAAGHVDQRARRDGRHGGVPVHRADFRHSRCPATGDKPRLGLAIPAPARAAVGKRLSAPGAAPAS